MRCHLGYFDLDSYRIEPVDNPFDPKVLTMSPESAVNDVSGKNQITVACPARLERATYGLEAGLFFRKPFIFNAQQ